MRSIERLSGPDVMSWPECTLDEPGMDALGGLLIGMGWDFRVLPADSGGWPAWAGSILVLSTDGLGAFEAFVFGLAIGFFFVVSLTTGILCPSC